MIEHSRISCDGHTDPAPRFASRVPPIPVPRRARCDRGSHRIPSVVVPSARRARAPDRRVRCRRPPALLRAPVGSATRTSASRPRPPGQLLLREAALGDVSHIVWEGFHPHRRPHRAARAGVERGSRSTSGPRGPHHRPGRTVHVMEPPGRAVVPEILVACGERGSAGAVGQTWHRPDPHGIENVSPTLPLRSMCRISQRIRRSCWSSNPPHFLELFSQVDSIAGSADLNGIHASDRVTLWPHA